MEWELIKTEYFFNLCPAISDMAIPLAVGISVAITLKIVFSFVLALKRRKEKKE